ncbi:transcription-repair coupling factor [Basilea psittacipulmonis]|uniref:Transcription-repair-coupling factor n=1 Tax=Basilea psittacipulmonis DSM 24701 TaxID=1072685 RepID=A0A077DFZ4_9BURK|nr:transcription-repair coupling factor [Basilea psittacipulmonis]AIL33081.1 transcription-repair coupling factor [Basilea psittacipulmonis DSM 24701]
MKLTEIKSIQEQFAKGKKAIAPIGYGSSDSLLLSELALSGQKLVVFCADPQQAKRLLEEISLFHSSLKVRHFPDWETLPYDTFSPHSDLVSERLKTLQSLLKDDIDVLTIPVSTALYFLCPKQYVQAHSFQFKQGDKISIEHFKENLINANYAHVSQVTAAGEFSVRGSLIDLFPMGADTAFRIDLFDDEIDSIRSFDIDTQLSIEPVDHIDLLPGREFPLDDSSCQRFRSKFRELVEGDPTKYDVYKDIGNGIASAGIEYFLPLFYDQVATIFDYLPQDTICCLHGDIQKSIHDFFDTTLKTYQFLKNSQERAVISPEHLFIKEDDFFNRLKSFSQLKFSTEKESKDFSAIEDVSVISRSSDPFFKLKNLLSSTDQRTLLCVDSLGRRETLEHILREQNLTPKTCDSIEDFLTRTEITFGICFAQLYDGFHIKKTGIHFLTENDLYPHTKSRTHRKQSKSSNIDLMIRDLAELHEGDPVVHVNYGIGKYLGLTRIDDGDGQIEMLHLEYANQTSLYVPVTHLHVISRYTGIDPDNVPLHKLGTDQWDRAKKKAAKQAHDVAAELLNLYARRQLREGTVFSLPLSDYHEFAQGFGFEETPDQADAIEAVIHDMTSGRAMDRLVCGDVGFGKTEVALRAAFICAANGKQVAILCPTTLLAEQHAKTFRDRFSEWPITVAELSRFRTGKETKQVIEGLSKGTVDIVVGTHKLISKDVRFKNLGLVIIDEEHRFGVKQKETLRSLRAEVDVLTLTATPIPRTLGMSLEGLRDFSVIATAPQKRLAIKTFVRKEDGSTIREAVLRELRRGGQVYFLHNEVDTIENRKKKLEELIPEANIAVAHGQMNERELESIMKGFYQHRYNVLLCTTIIETGIDVPNANTIIIHRADKLGLAQLHQLRGRVGRSHHQAYAYLLTPGNDAITKNAKLRLEAIQNLQELGSGFYLAMNDMEIRGTGEILGESQSGNIQDVGYSLYTEMLNKAITSLKNGYEPDLENPFNYLCEVNLHTSTLLPDDYCPDVHTRLTFYKRLAHAQNEETLIGIREEITDRFGVLPEATRALIESHRIRLMAEPLGITKVDIGDDVAIIHFGPRTKIDPKKLILLIQSQRQIKMMGSDKIRIQLKPEWELKQKIQFILQEIIQALQ